MTDEHMSQDTDEVSGAPAIEDDADEEPWDSSEDEVLVGEAAQPHGVYVSPRKMLQIIAVVLGAVLVALILYLIWLALPADMTTSGGEAQAGIIPELAIYGPGTGDQPRFVRPLAAAWDRSGNTIYVADTENNRIVAFDSDGKYLRQFGGFGIAKPYKGSAATWDPGELNYPADVAVDNGGDVYVADFYNDSVSVFDSKGKFLRRFPDPNKITGKGGSGQDGTGIAALSIAVSRGRVYVTDEYQVFVFTTRGKLLRQFGRPGADPGGLDRPGGIAVDARGRIYVSDSNHNRVTAFTPEGTVIWSTGEQIVELQKQTKNPFILPRGLTLMRDGSVVIADPLGHVLVKLDENGKLVRNFGMRGAEEGQVNFPNDVDASGDRIVLADRENNRIQVVRLSDR